MTEAQLNREGLLKGLSKSQVRRKRLAIAPVGKEEVAAIPDSGDEDNKQDLLLRRRIFL